MGDKKPHQPYNSEELSSQDIPVKGVEPNQIRCPVCGKTFKTNSEMERHMDTEHEEIKGDE